MKHFILLFCASVGLGGGTVEAGQRRFVYSYETVTSPKGSREYEQWLTWKAHKANDSDYYKLEFRHELEFGITDNFQLGLYLADWEIENGEAEYTKSAIELIHSFTDPTADPLGTALYFESGLGPEEFELEGKLLLQKNLGPVSLVYNFIVEAKWEGDGYDEEVGEIKNSFGIGYQISPSFSVGIEGLHEVELEDWSESGDNVFYLGPNLCLRRGGFFATLAPLVQVTDVDGEPDFNGRILIGFDF
jgi:hypothetical protein